jgi:hypothetical protein
LTEDGKKSERCRHLGGESAAQAWSVGGVLVALRGTWKSGDNNGIVMGLVGKFMGNSWEIIGI